MTVVHSSAHTPAVAPAVRAHVAIVSRLVATALQQGRKRIETRFSRTRRPPFGRVHGGDLVLFKISGGPVIGHCRVQRVRHYEGLDPGSVDRLHRRHALRVAAPDSYWKACRDCRFGVLIWLTRLQPAALTRTIPRQYGGGWIILDI